MVNLNNQTITSGPIELIPSSDVLKVPREDNVNKLSLPSSPDLYRMNTGDASLRVQKVNDNGEIELTYWDGTGLEPVGGYYTVSGGEIEFFGDAIIGSEPDDDAQDYYKFSYVSDSFQNEIFTTAVPFGAEIYNMHGEMGPRSLSIKVGGTVVTRDQLLSSRPTDVNNTNGVFVDDATGKIEFYGNLRPSYLEEVEVEYYNDVDNRNQVQTFSLTSYIDNYNLENPDLTTNRSLRVYVGGEEIVYDASKTNGYTYENGRVSLYGDARSDIASNEEVKIKYVYDSTSTSKDVYGIRLNNVPEVYNLGSTVTPNSIRVYRNSTEEIEYSNTNGFQYNSTTNTIELYGTSRPDVNDTYLVQMVVPTADVHHQDGKVEIALSQTPETYGTGEPITFLVEVDGANVEYDDTKTNGYFYNSQTNRIELYGDARPEANNTSNPDVKVSFVYESSSSSRGNDTYDFQLASNTLDYGLASVTGPKAIRVYQSGVEVPYDSENGFTYDRDFNRLSLHGSYRPDFDDNSGDFQVYSLTANDLVQHIPQNSYIYKVIMNGEEVLKVQDPTGNGYTVKGQQVEIVGNARPDITNSLTGVSLTVQYFDSLEISLNDHMPNNYFHNYCDHETGDSLTGAEVDPSQLAVTLDGNLLSTNQYSLQDSIVVLNKDSITLGAGNHTLSVDYRVRQAIGYEPNEFTFQVGANSGQNFKVEIASFDNLLRDTNIICVRTQEDAARGLKIIDNALDFVLQELGNVGAVENRLDHIATNLSVMEENTVASLSRIQDTDLAREAMSLLKEQILTQAQQAMAVHLKQSQEQVLGLLK
ncbi:flagellin [Metabacillus halosaccharovorans]|uniref:flagellin n=1 Tax=Metabacillus halosaccharovorans TaxID=930124 RepID=UPI000994D90F|nr:flagellin [Metabacillus halosaccharovorans]